MAGKEFRICVGKDLDPLSQAVPIVRKRRRNIVLSFSHSSVTTARLKTYNVHLAIGIQQERDQMGRDRQGLPKNKRREGEKRERYRKTSLRSTADPELWRSDFRELPEVPIVIKKVILDARTKADSEPAKLYVREPNWRPLQPKTCDTAIPESAKTTTAGSDVVQSGRPIFDDFFQHLWPYIDNNTANVVFQMVKRLWLIRIDQ
ncbi:hypothetical protein TNCV_3417531 [Trichonephila clavipes]|nr:hypothetical protein TNCV_3417531 [Trichonephila clavipes]